MGWSCWLFADPKVFPGGEDHLSSCRAEQPLWFPMCWHLRRYVSHSSNERLREDHSPFVRDWFMTLAHEVKAPETPEPHVELDDALAAANAAEGPQAEATDTTAETAAANLEATMMDYYAALTQAFVEMIVNESGQECCLFVYKNQNRNKQNSV